MVVLSRMLFIVGYDQGVMSGIITYGSWNNWFHVRGVYFKDYFDQPSRAQIGTMVAILEVGAFCTDLEFITDVVSSLAVGRIGDIIGRRRTIWYGALIFVVGGVLQTCAWSMAIMIIGRIISGVGVGLLSYPLIQFNSS